MLRNMKFSLSYIINLTTKCDFLNLFRVILELFFLKDLLDINRRPLRFKYDVYKAEKRTAQSKQPRAFLLGYCAN